MPPKQKKHKEADGDTVVIPATESLYYKLYDEYVVKYGAKTAILLQVGKFFEMYDSVDKVTGIPRANVQVLSEICGCATENRESRDPSKHRLFWGFPEISFMKFAKMLVDAGYNCIKYVQDKDSSGTVVNRVLEEVLSPGTFWDSAGGRSVRSEEQCMLSIYVEPWMDNSQHKQQHWYIATTAFDVTTGQSVSAETDVVLVDGKPVLDVLHPFWSLYPPAEVALFWCSSSEFPHPRSSDIQSLFCGRPPVHIRLLDPAEESTAVADRCRLTFFSEIFKHQSALSIGTYLDISRTPLVRRSLFHLLRFLQDHNPSFLISLHHHQLWNPEDMVILGNSALEQLAMLPQFQGKSNESLLHWLQRAQTAMGRRHLRERCLRPISDVETLNLRQEQIAQLRPASVRTPLETELRGAYDVSRLYRRFQLGNGTTQELLQLLTTYEKGQRLLSLTNGKIYGTADYELLGSHITEFLNVWSAERIQKSAKRVSDAIAVATTHPWKRGIHPHLDSFEDSWNVLEAEATTLRQSWESFLEEPDAIEWTLNDDAPFTFTTTARRGACVATIAKQRAKMDVAVIKHGSATKIKLECEQLRQLNTLALKLRSEWKSAVQAEWSTCWKIWMEAEIGRGALEAFLDFFGNVDVSCSLASVSEQYGYVRPTYVSYDESTVNSGFAVKELRHPIIERISDIPYIAHNIAYGSFSTTVGDDYATTPCGILLYGVNAAGKSSLGKAVGLAVLMAQCGMPVPATEMTLVPYTGLFTRILGNDNLWAGMSSFIVEMTEFRSILRNAGPRSLVIGDELCAGTETASATSIVAAGVKTLISRQSHFFFATHLHELATLPEIASLSAVTNYHLTVHSDADRGVLVYDRKLKEGCGSPMYGLEVCRGLDMDAEFLASAFTFRRKYYSDDGKMRVSTYNAGVVVSQCAVCGSRDGLETHHIIPQAQANSNGMVGAGKHKNDKANLAVLCDTCHNKHHSGLLEIQGWVGTTGGRRLAAKN